MRIAKSILFLSFLIFISSCSDDDDPITGTISGTVIDKVSGNVIGSAYIVTTPPSESVVSDSEGMYLIENVLPGDHTLVCEKEGYYKTHISINVQAGRTTNAIIPMLSIVDGNNPPENMKLKSPLFASKVRFETVIFTWDCDDNDGDKITYSLFLGKSKESLVLIAENIQNKSYQLNEIEDSTKYYWMIIAKDYYGATMESEVWNFDTEIKQGIPDQGGELVLYLPFDGDANDYSGNNLHGEVTDAQLVADRRENSFSAYSFNGSSSYINIEHSELFNKLENFTIACWVKPYSEPGKPVGNHIDIISRSSSAGGYYLGLTTSFNPEFWYGTVNGTDDYLRPGSVLSPGTWTHYAFVYSSELEDISGIGKMYLNGNLIATKKLVRPRGVELDMKIGCRNDFESFYHGSVDEIYIFSRALKESEVKDIVAQ